MKTKETISAGQLFLLLFVIRISGVLLYSAAIPRSGSLLTFLVPSLLWGVLLLLLWLPAWLSRRDLPQDPPRSRPRSFFYALLLVWLAAFHLFQIYHFLSEIADELLPLSLLLLILLASLFGAKRGIEALVRFSAVPFAALLIGLFFVFFFLYPSYSSSSLLSREMLPSYNGVENMIWLFSGSGELLYAWLLCPQTKGKWFRCSYLWILFYLLLLLFFLLLAAGSMGEYLIGRSFPFYHLLDGAGPLQRMRPLYMGLSVLIFCCTLSTEWYLSCKELKRSLPVLKNKGGALLLPAGVAGGLFWAAENGLLPAEWLFDRSVICSVILCGGFLLPCMELLMRRLRKSAHPVRAFARGTGLLLAVLLLLWVPGGCRAVQLNQRMIVQGIGIDRQERQYRLTLLVLLTDEADRENRFRLVYAQGPTVQEAFQTLENQKGKSLLLDQCQFLMLNEEGADHHAESLSYFEDHEHMMKTANIMVTNGSSSDLLRKAVEENGYDPESLNLLSDSRVVRQQTVHFTLFDYIASTHEPHKAMLLPYLRTEEAQKTIENSESYLLTDDPKDCFYLNTPSTNSLQLLKGTIVSCTYQTGEAHRTISVQSVVWHPEIRHDKLVLQVRVTADSDQPANGQAQKRLYQTVYCCLKRAAEKPLHRRADPFSLRSILLSQGTAAAEDDEIWGSLLKTCQVDVDLTLNGDQFSK